MFKENVDYILSSHLTLEVISDDELLASLCTFVASTTFKANDFYLKAMRTYL